MILLPIFVSVTNKTKFMPEICRFFGIIIFLYWKDHNPPHIHFTSLGKGPKRGKNR